MALRALCIIPARGGSKRIPRKNILPLNGRPLISYSIRAAIDSGMFDDVIVSTEDGVIKEIALSEGAQVDDRPAHMAGDTVTKVQVVKEFLERVNGIEKYSSVTALLPTCPFRTAEHLKEAFSIFRAHPELPFLIGVTEYEFPIQLALSPMDEEKMEVTFENGYKVTRSQDIGKRYHPNGAMYIATVKAFLDKGTFFNDKMLTYKMSAIRSYDIDYPYQFEIAEIIAKNIHRYE
ncbi:MAG TPA: acylneuraminate cytidylyltransferase family protein [Bacteroidia bacterium]|jgi:CMP-N-acetylneuraminic acid synthetase|nr:acylneuraminate cytidylyltransferase family protein [Bacteroidia bacterium]